MLGAPPGLLTELLGTLSGVRARLEAELSSPTARLRSQRLETSCWPLAMLQQPLMEVPAQYACQERSPALDQHALVERFQAAVGVHLDRASGETTRIITLRADDGTSHSFALRRAPLRRSHAPLGHERMGQLARLLNARLLGAREARRRSPISQQVARSPFACHSLYPRQRGIDHRHEDAFERSQPRSSCPQPRA